MARVKVKNLTNSVQKSHTNAGYWKKLFWDYRLCASPENIPGPIRAQRYVDYWPEIHFDYKEGRLSIQDIKNIVGTIHQFGPVKYSEPVREYIIKKLITRWFNE